MTETNKKLAPALILNGAGARTAYQVGVIQALGEILPVKACPFPVISGTSAGSINAAFIASRADNWAVATETLAAFWKNICLNQIYETSGLSLSKISSAWVSRIVLSGLIKDQQSSNFLLDTKPLSKLLSQTINYSDIRKNIETGNLQAISISTIEYFEETTVVFFDAAPGFDEWISAGRIGVRTEIEKKHIMASTAIPVFFPPIPIGESYFGDGCLRQTSPLSPAIHLGADRIISIGIRQERKKTKHVEQHVKKQSPAIAEILGEVFNALFLDSLDPDIERLKRINDAIKNQYSENNFQRKSSLRIIPILHLAPSRNLGELIPDLIKTFPTILSYFLKGLGASDVREQGKELISYLAFTKECVTPLMELGFEDTMNKKEMILQFMQQILD